MDQGLRMPGAQVPGQLTDRLIQQRLQQALDAGDYRTASVLFSHMSEAKKKQFQPQLERLASPLRYQIEQLLRRCSYSANELAQLSRNLARDPLRARLLSEAQDRTGLAQDLLRQAQAVAAKADDATLRAEIDRLADAQGRLADQLEVLNTVRERLQEVREQALEQLWLLASIRAGGEAFQLSPVLRRRLLAEVTAMCDELLAAFPGAEAAVRWRQRRREAQRLAAELWAQGRGFGVRDRLASLQRRFAAAGVWLGTPPVRRAGFALGGLLLLVAVGVILFRPMGQPPVSLWSRLVPAIPSQAKGTPTPTKTPGGVGGNQVIPATPSVMTIAPALSPIQVPTQAPSITVPTVAPTGTTAPTRTVAPTITPTPTNTPSPSPTPEPLPAQIIFPAEDARLLAFPWQIEITSTKQLDASLVLSSADGNPLPSLTLGGQLSDPAPAITLIQQLDWTPDPKGGFVARWTSTATDLSELINGQYRLFLVASDDPDLRSPATAFSIADPSARQVVKNEKDSLIIRNKPHSQAKVTALSLPVGSSVRLLGWLRYVSNNQIAKLPNEIYSPEWCHYQTDEGKRYWTYCSLLYLDGKPLTGALLEEKNVSKLALDVPVERYDESK